MRTLYFDCAMGAAGDMLTAALLELVEDREAALKRINAALGGRARVSCAADKKCGIRGTHVTVTVAGREEDEHMHEGHAHHHHHTGLAQINAAIDATALPEKVREDAKRVYQRIAQAESEVHGERVEQIHFHEVGTMDALADVLSVCLLMDEIKAERIVVSPINVGSGTVKCAHGILPVPTPATELLLRGVPTYAGMVRSELCTPTGAALLRHFADEFGPMPLMRVMKTGCGTGKKDFEAANLVRAMLGETEEHSEDVLELRCNLDDMTGEELGYAQRALFACGALDVYTVSIGMKKNRPGTMLCCLCREGDRESVLACLFRHTQTLGVREYRCARTTLARTLEQRESSLGPVCVKTAQGWGVRREKIEYESLAAIAEANGLSLRETEQRIRKELG